jgi:hypothetical protein
MKTIQNVRSKGKKLKNSQSPTNDTIEEVENTMNKDMD